MEACARKPYPSDVSDDEWALVAPYLTLLREDAGQRGHPLRELFNGLRYLVRTGIPWRSMPHDLPPWEAVHGQATRWLRAGCFDALAQDLRAVLRMAGARQPDPTAAVLDSRTLRSTPESGARAGYDGAKRKKGSKVHLAVDTLGHLLALHVTPADADDRSAVGKLARDVQDATGSSVEVAFVDQGFTESGRRRPRPRTASAWRWSSCPRPSAASCCCPGAGWSSAPSPGRPGSAGWSRTTSACTRPSPTCTPSPSPASC